MKQLNFQSELHYDFRIQKLENLPLFVQDVTLPGISTEAPQTGTVVTPIKHVGDTAFFEPLIVSLKLDEGMECWFEMFTWLTGLTRTEDFGQFVQLLKDNAKSLDGSKQLFKKRAMDSSGKGYKNIKSVASLIINDSNHVPYMEIVYMNLHPTAIGGFTFRTDASNVGFITFNVYFAYDFYFPKPLR